MAISLTVMPGRSLTRRRTSCRREMRFEPDRPLLAELCGERARRACVAAADVFAVAPLPSSRGDTADRALVVELPRRRRVVLRDAGRC